MYLTAFHAIEESLRAGAAGPLLLAKAGPRARELSALAARLGVRVDRTGTHDLDRLAPGNRGVALLAEGPAGAAEEATLDGFLAGLGGEKNALVVVLDDITDPHNWGAILRSCDQFGVGLVLARGRRNAKNAPAVAAASAGASAWVPVAEEPNLGRALDRLRDAGFWVYGADMAGGPVWERDLRGRVALVLGGEAGLGRLLREACDALVAIPTCGRVDSLNVSVAAGVLLYEAQRQQAH